mgnify:CR=1 FL=1
MKKIVILILTFLIILFSLSGCETINNFRKEYLNIDDNNDEKNIGEDKNKIETRKDYPQTVYIWLENMKKYFVAGDIKINQERYVIVNWGEKRSGGYEVKIQNIKEKEKEIEVIVLFQKPEKESNIQVITYPTAVKLIENPEKKITFVAKGAEEYIPVIRGKQPVTPFQSESENIKIMKYSLNNNQLIIEGLARIFEANINYNITNKDKKILKEGFITASTGAPDWGYFKIELETPENAHYINLFSRSMKDGSKENQIRLTLNKI